MNLPLAIGLGVLAGLAAYALVLVVFTLRDALAFLAKMHTALDRITPMIDRLETSPIGRILIRSNGGSHAEGNRS